MWTLREFLGSPLVRCPQARARVHSLVGELRFCKPGSVAKKTQKMCGPWSWNSALPLFGQEALNTETFLVSVSFVVK